MKEYIGEVEIIEENSDSDNPVSYMDVTSEAFSLNDELVEYDGKKVKITIEVVE